MSAEVFRWSPTADMDLDGFEDAVRILSELPPDFELTDERLVETKRACDAAKQSDGKLERYLAAVRLQAGLLAVEETCPGSAAVQAMAFRKAYCPAALPLFLTCLMHPEIHDEGVKWYINYFRLKDFVMESYEAMSLGLAFDEPLECPVCFRQRPHLSTDIACPNGHFICFMCMAKWTAQSAQCPVCRSTIDGAPMTLSDIMNTLQGITVTVSSDDNDLTMEEVAFLSTVIRNLAHIAE